MQIRIKQIIPLIGIWIALSLLYYTVIKNIMKISNHDENVVAILMSSVGIGSGMVALKLWLGVNKRMNIKKGEKIVVASFFAIYAAISLAMPIIMIQLVRDPFLEIEPLIFLILAFALLLFAVFWIISLKYTSNAS